MDKAKVAVTSNPARIGYVPRFSVVGVHTVIIQFYT